MGPGSDCPPDSPTPIQPDCPAKRGAFPFPAPGFATAGRNRPFSRRGDAGYGEVAGGASPGWPKRGPWMRIFRGRTPYTRKRKNAMGDPFPWRYGPSPPPTVAPRPRAAMPRPSPERAGGSSIGGSWRVGLRKGGYIAGACRHLRDRRAHDFCVAPRAYGPISLARPVWLRYAVMRMASVDFRTAFSFSFQKYIFLE